MTTSQSTVESPVSPPAMPGWRFQLVGYPATSHFATVGGRDMHFLDEGSGSPMLMVHGNPTWSFYYRHLVNHFSPSRRAIAVDHIGCGLSARPPDYEYTLNQRIEDLFEFVQQRDLQRITLVVHDWGGPIGVGAALRDLVRYERIVILNSALFPPPYFPWRIRICRFPILGRCAVQGGNLFARAATTMATHLPEGLSADVCQGLLAPYDSWSNRRAIYEFVADIPTRSAQPTWKFLEEIDSELTHLSQLPVKLIWGMQDWCFRPRCLQLLKQRIPHAEVCEIASAGHYVLEDAPQRVIEEIEKFLQTGSTP